MQLLPQAQQDGLTCAEFVAALHRCLIPVPEPPSIRRTLDNSPYVRPYFLKYAPKERSADGSSAEHFSEGASKLDAKTAALLSEMFAYIDVRDTGRVQWAQFTAYMLEVSWSNKCIYSSISTATGSLHANPLCTATVARCDRCLLLVTVGQAGKSCNGSVNDSTIHTELPRYQYKGVLDVCNKPVALAENIQYFEANDCLTYLEPSARSFQTYSCSSGALHDLIVKKRTVKYTLPVPKEAAAAVNLANVTSGLKSGALITTAWYTYARTTLWCCMHHSTGILSYTQSLHRCNQRSERVHVPAYIACLHVTQRHGTIYSGDTGGAVRAWNHADLFTLEPPQYRDIPTHTVLGAACTKQWSKNDPHPTEAHTDVVTNLLHLPELGLLASTSLDHTIKLWDLATCRLRRSLTGHAQGVKHITYCPHHNMQQCVVPLSLMCTCVHVYMCARARCIMWSIACTSYCLRSALATCVTCHHDIAALYNAYYTMSVTRPKACMQYCMYLAINAIPMSLCFAHTYYTVCMHYAHRLIASGGFAFDVVLSNPYVQQPISKLHGHTAPIVGVQIVPGKFKHLKHSDLNNVISKRAPVSFMIVRVELPVIACADSWLMRCM
eukprot:3868-Heterococcus_DN1.PRE.4